MKTMPILRLLLLAKKYPILSGKACYEKKTLSAARDAAEEIMIANKEKIVKALLKQEQLHEYSFLDGCEISKNYYKWFL